MKLSEQYASIIDLVPNYYLKRSYPFLLGIFSSPIEDQAGSTGLGLFSDQGHDPLFWSYHTRPGRGKDSGGIANDAKAAWIRIDPFQPFREYF